MDLVGAGAIFIDDIVLPDGRTYMERVGGGVVHALMGAAVWGERPGLSAFAGYDLSSDVRAFLEQHLDTQGLVTLDMPQARAWQIFEWDGTRRELHRVKDVSRFVAGTQPEHLPEAYRNAKACYLLQDFDGIRGWCEHVSGLVLWEPNALVMLPENRDLFRAALRDCTADVVSPNLQEARMIYGELAPDALLDAMLSDGARVVLLRMGQAGSMAADSQTRCVIPAVPVESVMDQTGAGNTYCGAFLAGFMRGRSLSESAAMGATAASFCVETIGVIDSTIVKPQERDRRYDWVMEHLRKRINDV